MTDDERLNDLIQKISDQRIKAILLVIRGALAMGTLRELMNHVVVFAKGQLSAINMMKGSDGN